MPGAISDNTVLTTLYKKYIGYTNTGDNVLIDGEYPLNASSYVYLNKMFLQEIPATAPTLSTNQINLPGKSNKDDGHYLIPTVTKYKYLIKYENVKLTALPGKTGIFVYANESIAANVGKNILRQAIKPTSDPVANTYRIKITYNNGIELFVSNYIFDTDTGVLRIFDFDTVITGANPPRISFWRYEGATGSERNPMYLNSDDPLKGYYIYSDVSNGQLVWKIGSNNVNLGSKAAFANNSANVIAIGSGSGNQSTDPNTISIGSYIDADGLLDAQQNQKEGAISIGINAGKVTQGLNAIAIGYSAGTSNQSNYSIAIGYEAGRNGTGTNSILIGNSAYSSNSESVIVLKATNDTWAAKDAGFYVDPIRSVATSSTLYYNNVTKEITYGNAPSGSGGSSIPDTWANYPALSNINMNGSNIINLANITGTFGTTSSWAVNRQFVDCNFVKLSSGSSQIINSSIIFSTASTNVIDMSNNRITNIRNIPLASADAVNSNFVTSSVSNWSCNVAKANVNMNSCNISNIGGTSYVTWTTGDKLTLSSNVATIGFVTTYVSNNGGGGSNNVNDAQYVKKNEINTMDSTSAIEFAGSTGYINGINLATLMQGTTNPSLFDSYLVNKGYMDASLNLLKVNYSNASNYSAYFSNNFPYFSNNYTRFSNNYTDFSRNYISFSNNYTDFSRNYISFSNNYTDFSRNYIQFSNNYTTFSNNYTTFSSNYTQFNIKYGNMTNYLDLSGTSPMKGSINMSNFAISNLVTTQNNIINSTDSSGLAVNIGYLRQYVSNNGGGSASNWSTFHALNDVNMSNNRIINVANGINANDAVNRSQLTAIDPSGAYLRLTGGTLSGELKTDLSGGFENTGIRTMVTATRVATGYKSTSISKGWDGNSHAAIGLACSADSTAAINGFSAGITISSSKATSTAAGIQLENIISSTGAAIGLFITADLNGASGTYGILENTNNANVINALTHPLVLGRASLTQLPGLLLDVNGSAIIHGELNMIAHKIINLDTPTEDTDAATKKYVDDAVGTSGGGSGSGISVTASNFGEYLYYDPSENSTNKWKVGGSNSINIGCNSGRFGTSNRNGSIAIGIQAGSLEQNGNAIAIGRNAGETSQKMETIAIDNFAGQSNQATKAIAIGRQAGMVIQGEYSIAIGEAAAAYNSYENTIAIGNQAGYKNQGKNSICIGQMAGYNSTTDSIRQGEKSILMNATGEGLVNSNSNSFTIKPIRTATNIVGLKQLYWDPDTGEIFAAP
jgi:hypothetical protein